MSFKEIQELLASDGMNEDLFGVSVSISGTTAVVGAHGDEVNGHANQGSAYIFEFNATTSVWEQKAKLTASDGNVGDQLGVSVAIDGDTVVVGAFTANVSGHANQGAAYVYIKPAAGWVNHTEDAKLTAAMGFADDQFGSSVSISGDTIAVGAIQANTAGTQKGAAYIFEKPPGGWHGGLHEQAKLTDAAGNASNNLGNAISILDDTVVVGDTGDNVIGPDAGAAFVYVKPASGWVSSNTPTAKLTASDAETEDLFGSSVAISSDTIVVGAENDDINGNERQGSAYVFIKREDGWSNATEDAKLTASDGMSSHFFGVSVSISEDFIIAGAFGGQAAYVFIKPPNGWNSIPSQNEFEKLTATGSGFGFSVSIDGNNAVIGSLDTTGPGVAYIFENCGVTSVIQSPNGGGSCTCVEEDGTFFIRCK